MVLGLERVRRQGAVGVLPVAAAVSLALSGRSDQIDACGDANPCFVVCVQYKTS